MPSPRQSMSCAFQGIFFKIRCVLFFLLLLISFAAPSIAAAVSGPPQASGGPGGEDYACSKVISNSYGSGALKYYLFEPDSPKPTSAPLIVFIHGWGATGPSSYGAWIEHIVKKGNIVVFPVYQSSFTKPAKYTSNTLSAVLSSIEVLKSNNHVKPELDKFAVLGHSAGGIITANIGALAVESGLPAPRVIMPIEPGRMDIISLVDPSKIPADTLLLTIVGDQDFVAGDKSAKHIFYGTPQIGLDRKDFVIMVSDYHGYPHLKADHFAPAGRTADPEQPSFSRLDALDYYCLWKLFDALTDTAFYGKNREYALGNTPQQRYMGKWDDGTPVKTLIITDKP